MPPPTRTITGRVLITGPSGVGKSTLARYFRERGENAFDSEEGGALRGLNQSADLDGHPFRITKEQWRRAEEWQHHWDRAVLARFLARRRNALVFGASDNMFDMADLFDRRIYLRVSWSVLRTRLSHSARDNDWGSEPGQMRWIRTRAREWPKKARAAGFEFVDATLSPARILSQIRDTRVRVLRCRPADRSSAVELFRQLTEAHRDLYHDPTIGSKDPARTFRAHLRETRGGGTWVAVHGGRVVGLAGLIAHRGWGEVEPVVVLEGFRRRGVARRLVRSVIAEARRRRFRILTIRPVGRNLVALRTFHALGFRTLGHIGLDMRPKGQGRFHPIPGPRLAGRRFQM